MIEPSVYEFLDKLKNNNNRPWFKENKSLFDYQHNNIKTIPGFWKRKNDVQLETYKILEYKDVRFSKDKLPYKTHFAIAFHRIKPKFRGGFYVHLQPGNTFIASGFGPEKKIYLELEKEIELDGEVFEKVIENKKIIDSWGPIQGIL